MTAPKSADRAARLIRLFLARPVTWREALDELGASQHRNTFYRLLEAIEGASWRVRRMYDGPGKPANYWIDGRQMFKEVR